MNELYRVLIPGGTAWLAVPYWASSRAYGDPTHLWPPIGEMTLFYYSRAWRLQNAVHTDASVWHRGFNCDFDFNAGYTLHPEILGNSIEVQRAKIQWQKEAAQDMQFTLSKPFAPR